METNFKINSDGLKRYKYVKNNFILSLTLGPFIYSFVLFLIYLSIGSKSMIVFYLILGLTIIYISIFNIYALGRLIKRQNKTISEISFSGDEITLRTNELLWLDSMNFTLKKNSLEIIKRKFAWYGQQDKEGSSIISENIELFLVKDYFEEYDEILLKLNIK